jgi:ABC-type multidrug transport system fused ATPase/permease subunit
MMAEGSRPIGHLEAMRDFARALRYVRPVRGLFARKILFMLSSALPAIVLPWPGKVLVDHVVQDLPLDATTYPFFFQPFVDALEGRGPIGIAVLVMLLSAAMLLVFGGWSSDARDQTSAGLAQGQDSATQSENDANQGHSFVGGLVGWFEFRLTLRISHILNHHYRSHLFERVQHLPMTRLDDQRIGDAMYRLMYDTPQITEVCSRLILTPIVVPFQAAAAIWVMYLAFRGEPIVLWGAALLVPLGFLVTLPFTSSVRRLGQASRETGATTTTTIEEGMNNVQAVQGLGGSVHERARFERDSWSSFTQYRRFVLLWIGIAVAGVVAGGSVGLVVFYALTDRVFEGALTVGDLWVILAYYGGLAFLADNVARLWIYLQDNAVGLRRVFELMDEPSDYQPADPLPLETIREGFAFEDVHFQYADGTEALRGVSFQASLGSMVALVGPAGAGKTTLAYMLPRFLLPTRGKIRVDGVPLLDVDREDLRRQIAFVFQEPVLFDATVEENIRIGRPDATREQILEAARLAGAAEFIERLPQGLATRLGRGGGRLSVGQKQRLSIARALVREAPVLILDEPTAALDPETELGLVRTLRDASRHRLVVVIAHRLSTIRSADEILFLEDGRIRERGSHQQLMAREGGAYRRFVELQSAAAA